jgi:hypothetical protein
VTKLPSVAQQKVIQQRKTYEAMIADQRRTAELKEKAK